MKGSGEKYKMIGKTNGEKRGHKISWREDRVVAFIRTESRVVCTGAYGERRGKVNGK